MLLKLGSSTYFPAFSISGMNQFHNHAQYLNSFCSVTQGLNYITGLLLLIVKDEESVFWLLDMMISNILPGIQGILP